MNRSTDQPIALPTEVIAAINSGHKIQAIKLLREAKGLGLAEAKDAVDDYIRANPSLVQRKSSSGGVLVYVILFGLLTYVAYQFIG